jgi:hypothetical protein
MAVARLVALVDTLAGVVCDGTGPAGTLYRCSLHVVKYFHVVGGERILDIESEVFDGVLFNILLSAIEEHTHNLVHNP